jgi:hypothetical protein
MGHPIFCLGPDQSLVLRGKYRDPSLGVARLRARLRCLRMTINRRRLYRSLDSAMRNDFLGEGCGALHLGGRRTVLLGLRGVKGIRRDLVKALVPLRLRSGQALRGLNRIFGLAAWLKPCLPIGLMSRASIAVRNSGNGKEETSGAQMARNRAGCRSLHCLQS